jgi:hypothetical protein
MREGDANAAALVDRLPSTARRILRGTGGAQVFTPTVRIANLGSAARRRLTVRAVESVAALDSC